MFALSFILVSLVIQLVYSQEPPAKCRGPPPGITNPRECCKIPNIFSEEDLSACGIEKPDDNAPHKHVPHDCSKSICVLKRMNLIKDETKLDKDAASAIVDKFATDNPEFADAVTIAKQKCLTADLPGPPHVCEPDRAIFCISHVLFENCPNWQDTDNCKKLKDHIEECKSFISH